MRIESAKGGNCVCHGLSVMRLALGYADGAPGPHEIGGKNAVWLLEHAQEWFPRHRVHVWADQESQEEAKGPVYEGDFCPKDKRENMLIGFAYYTDESEDKGHFVVGDCVLYGGMKTCMIIGVELESPQSPPESE